MNAELAQVGKEAAIESGMSRADASHFNVKYEGGENAVAGHLIKLLLEEAYHKVGADLSFTLTTGSRLFVYQRAVQGRNRLSGVGGRAFDGRIKVPAGGGYGKTELLEQVLFHGIHARRRKEARRRASRRGCTKGLLNMRKARTFPDTPVHSNSTPQA